MEQKEAKATAENICKMRLELLREVKMMEEELLHLSKDFGLDITLSEVIP